MASVTPSRPSPRDRRAWSRTLAAIVGGLAATLALTVAVASVMPLSPPVRGMLALLLSFPTWVIAAIYAYLARSAARAWAVLIAVALAASLAASLA